MLNHIGKMTFKLQECGPGLSHNSTLKIHIQSNTWDKPISVHSAEQGFFSLCKIEETYINP